MKLSKLIPSGGLPTAFMNQAYIQWAQQDFVNTQRELGYDDGLFDIFRDTSKIASQNNVAVNTLDGGDADGVSYLLRNETPQTINIDDFEDGDILGWSGDTGSFSADNTDPISGDYSIKSEVNDDAVVAESPSVTESSAPIWVSLRIGSKLNEINDGVEITVLYSSSMELGSLRFIDDGNIEWTGGDGQNTLVTDFWEAGQVYQVKFVPDYNEYTVDVYLNGTQIGSGLTPSRELSGVTYLELLNDTNTGGGSRSVWFDNIAISNGEAATGNLLSTTKDLGFTPTTAVVSDEVDLNNGSLDYTIEDGNSNTVNISRSELDTEVDISSLTSSVISIQANLSSSNGENTPELYSYAAYFQE